MELYLHFSNASSWRGAQLKAQGQLYLYHLNIIPILHIAQFERYCFRNHFNEKDTGIWHKTQYNKKKSHELIINDTKLKVTFDYELGA